MANWYKESQSKVSRYRAVIPVDIWISVTGDAERDRETAYNMLKNILDNGAKSVNHHGFNDLLSLSDVDTYTNTLNSYGL